MNDYRAGLERRKRERERLAMSTGCTGVLAVETAVSSMVDLADGVTDSDARHVVRILLGVFARRRVMEELAEEIAALDAAGCCTGIEEWRGDILYARHSTGESCPVHGEPAVGKRLVKYIGKKKGAQTAAQAQMARQQQVMELRQWRDRLGTELAEHERELRYLADRKVGV